jgi:hypothetical protein
MYVKQNIINHLNILGNQLPFATFSNMLDRPDIKTNEDSNVIHFM